MSDKTLVIIAEELRKTAEVILKTSQQVDETFLKAVELIYSCEGKTVVTGMGKTGLIGRKISATLSSTGSNSIFLHAAEGIHGDLGILDKKDVILAISYSGNTRELVEILPYFRFLQTPIIAVTGNLSSQLAKAADVVLDCSVPNGYEPFNLVPTVSTTLALSIGDALAVALLKKRKFNLEDFARYHPGGTIGKKLLLRVEDLMHKDQSNPLVNDTESMSEVIMVMTRKGLGCASVIDDNHKLLGIVTDGDLRRLLTRKEDIMRRTAAEAMTVNPKSATPFMLAVDALNLMEKHKITMLPVVDKEGKSVGMLHMHDLIDAGVV
jgi:arabinose-5-phosphate isomerase